MAATIVAKWFQDNKNIPTSVKFLIFIFIFFVFYPFFAKAITLKASV